jgi:hypothetical protein
MLALMIVPSARVMAGLRSERVVVWSTIMMGDPDESIVARAVRKLLWLLSTEPALPLVRVMMACARVKLEITESTTRFVTGVRGSALIPFTITPFDAALNVLPPMTAAAPPTDKVVLPIAIAFPLPLGAAAIAVIVCCWAPFEIVIMACEIVVMTVVAVGSNVNREAPSSPDVSEETACEVDGRLSPAEENSFEPPLTAPVEAAVGCASVEDGAAGFDSGVVGFGTDVTAAGLVGVDAGAAARLLLKAMGRVADAATAAAESAEGGSNNPLSPRLQDAHFGSSARRAGGTGRTGR